MDALVIIVLVVFFVLGLFKGVLHQLATILGLLCAFIFAGSLSPVTTHLLSGILGSTVTVSELIAPIITGVLIFFTVRLIGIGLEKIFISKVHALKGINILGGGFLALIKGLMLWILIFFFIHLVPPSFIASWMPKLFESTSYQRSLKHNPLGSKDVIARFQTYRKTRKLEKKYEAQQKNLQEPDAPQKSMQDVLMDYLLEQAMSDPEKLLEMMQESNKDNPDS